MIQGPGACLSGSFFGQHLGPRQVHRKRRQIIRGPSAERVRRIVWAFFGHGRFTEDIGVSRSRQSSAVLAHSSGSKARSRELEGRLQLALSQALFAKPGKTAADLDAAVEARRCAAELMVDAAVEALPWSALGAFGGASAPRGVLAVGRFTPVVPKNLGGGTSCGRAALACILRPLWAVVPDTDGARASPVRPRRHAALAGRHRGAL